jgi:uncharacterized protein (TIGR03437 family)
MFLLTLFTGPLFAQCTFTLNPSSALVSEAGGTGSFAVVASKSGCAWSASSSASWLTITFGQTGSGNGSVGYRADANTVYTPRTGTISVAGNVFSVTQDALPCPASYFTPTSQAVPPAGGAFSISITSPCGWNAAADASWITLSANSGSSSGILSYTVAADNTGASRSGTIDINGSNYTVLQSGLNCTYTVTPLSVNVGPAGGQNQISVQVSDSSCLWAVQNTASWISNITIGGKAGSTASGNAVVGYTVTANNSQQSRNATLSVADQEVMITQTGNVCTFTVSPTSADVPYTANASSFGVTTSLANCPWTATTTASWISLISGASGNATGTVGYAVETNTATQPRSGTISVSTTPFSLTQDACSARASLAPQSQTVPPAGGNFNVAVSTVCAWTASTNASWIALNAGSGTTGNGSLSYTVAPNNTASPRSGTIQINSQTFTVTQSGINSSGSGIQPQAIVNGASFLNGPIAPGELISIFGMGLGPAQPAGLQTTPDGHFVTTSLAGTQVLINGMAAPLTYVSATQVNAIVPFELAGTANAQVILAVQNLQSSPLTASMVSTAPAIFAASGGTGQGAILNQDNSANSASNPAAVGSVLQIFATGFGQTNPSGVDGQIAGATPSIPLASVTATVGGINAPVEYVGSSNGLVAGVTQVNVHIPSGVTPGNAVPVVLTVSGNPSSAGITVAVH